MLLLDVSINYCPQCYTSELLDYYPFLRGVDIYVADDDDFDRLGLSDALAATDRNKIIIVRRNLPWSIFRHSLFHECEHFIHSHETPEYLVDLEARKKDGFNYEANVFGSTYELKTENNNFRFEVSSYNNSKKRSKLPEYLV